MESERDLYRVLQVDPDAHESVIRAAYRALARLYHPDGADPDGDRMTELNSAYELLRNPTRRRAYDAGRRLAARRAPGGAGGTHLRPVGPGPAATDGAESTTGTSQGVAERPSPAPPVGAFARARPNANSPRLDFGRYQGWTLADLARSDPDYLRWLRRHSSGLRYRAEINRLLPPDSESEPMGARGRRL